MGVIRKAYLILVVVALISFAGGYVDATEKAKVNIKIATELLKNFTFSTPLELNCNFFTHTHRQICPQFNQKRKLFKCFVQRKLNPANPPHKIMYRLCVVISVNCYILFAQVAAVAKITCLSCTQINSYCVLDLRDYLACLFSVKPCRFAIF